MIVCEISISFCPTGILKFSVEVLHLVLKFGEDRIFNEKIFFTQEFIFEKQFSTLRNQK